MVLVDRRWKVREIVKTIGISHGLGISVENYPQDEYRVVSLLTTKSGEQLHHYP